jgi:DNA-binding CsgD family transcriptional regulator
MRGGVKPKVVSESEQDTAAQAGMVLMDLSYRVLAIDSGATSILTALRDQKRKGDSASEGPLTLADEVRQLMMDSRRAGPNSSVVNLVSGVLDYTGHTYRLEPQNGFNQPMTVLYLKRNIVAKDYLGRAALEYRLTERERETLLGMVMGLTNKELAKRMEISTGTAKAFVRMVMAKMGVASRAAVVAKVLAQMTAKSISGILQILLCL